jgi:hypothetical protein
VSFKEAKERKAGIFVVQNHRYQKTKNRLLKVCYVPGTNARLPRLPFLMRLLTVLMKQTRQAVCAIKQSIYLDIYALPPFECCV